MDSQQEIKLRYTAEEYFDMYERLKEEYITLEAKHELLLNKEKSKDLYVAEIVRDAYLNELKMRRLKLGLAVRFYTGAIFSAALIWAVWFWYTH